MSSVAILLSKSRVFLKIFFSFLKTFGLAFSLRLETFGFITRGWARSHLKVLIYFLTYADILRTIIKKALVF